jgi:uncharacterized protein (TIGR00251 family)
MSGSGAAARPAGLRLEVLLQPRASRNAVVGWQGKALKVAVCAPPVDGQANAALEEFLAKALGLRRRQVSVVAGHASRRKTLSIQGLDAEALGKQLHL